MAYPSSSFWIPLHGFLPRPPQCLVVLAMATRGTVLSDQVVYAAQIEFSLTNRSEVDIVREAFLSIPICSL
jgi:hypothetical protein